MSLFNGILKKSSKENKEYRLTDKGAYLYHKIEQDYTAAYIVEQVDKQARKGAKHRMR